MFKALCVSSKARQSKVVPYYLCKYASYMLFRSRQMSSYDTTFTLPFGPVENEESKEKILLICNTIPNQYMTPHHTHDVTHFTPWWRHQMEIFSALLAICAGNSPVAGEFTAPRPVTRSFDVFFGLRLNKRLRKQWWDWLPGTPSSSSWRHCNAMCWQLVCESDLIDVFVEFVFPIVYSLLTLCLFTLLTYLCHYCDVIMGGMASQITSPTLVHSNVYSCADQRELQSSASQAFVRGIHRWLLNSPHEWPVVRKMFAFDDVIMYLPIY